MNIQLDINTSTPIEDLLHLWVSYTDKMHSGGFKTTENIQGKIQVKKILDNKGVTDIEIFLMDEEKYTLKYRLKGNKVTTIVPIKK